MTPETLGEWIEWVIMVWVLVVVIVGPPLCVIWRGEEDDE